VFHLLKKVLGIAKDILNGPAERQDKKQSKPSKPRKSQSPRVAKPDRAPERSRAEKKSPSRQKETAAKSSKRTILAAAPVIPDRPAVLEEVPEAEGKHRFLEYPIHQDILFGLQHLKFQYATPIQAMTLPHLLDGRDIAGKAQTGTGKTAAFLIAAFTHLLNNPKPQRENGECRVLVLAPTRELAIQIHNDAEAIGIFTGLHNVVVFGGMDHEKQRRELARPVDILIGTPGRIIDYARSGSLKLRNAEFLIIDEADRMLDMGFIPDVRRIVTMLPKKENRHTMLFSATLDESILKLASSFLTNPVMLESEPDQLVSDNIEQTFYTVSRDEKLAVLLYFIRNLKFDRMLVFGNRKDVNLRLQHDLARYGVKVPILSGDIAQDKRIKILDRFREGLDRIVIATDVAARGIHVDDVSVVVNFDLPERAEDYVHRIGRTGRAGHKGTAISFLCEYGAYNLPAIEKMLSVQFHSILPEEEMLVLPPPDPDYHEERRSYPRARRSAHAGRPFRGRR